jgi:hypothetical protein
MKLSEANKAMLMSYARSCIGAGIAVYMTGNHDLKDMGNAVIAALVPVAIRWVNSNDSAFGRTE